MGRKLIGVYYETASEARPVEEWLEKQSNPVQAKIHKCMNLLEGHFEDGPFSFVRNIRDGLFEIKLEIDKMWPRIIYFHYERDYIVYLHGFNKKENKTPKKEIDIALQRKADFIKRRN